MARLARILIYPLKSFDPVAVPESAVLPGGALQDDRRYAFFDEAGKVVNGKRSALVHRLRTEFDLGGPGVTVRDGDAGRTFHCDRDRAALAAYVGEKLGLPVRLDEDHVTGFPDDLDAPGPTVISTATLAAVADWFPGLGVDEVRRRFRANLEVDGVEPFWEDRLYTTAGRAVRFRAGGVVFEGTNPCQRCVVPSRDSADGTVWPKFGPTFSRLREGTLPAWADRSRFNHFYRLAVNTRPADSAGGRLRVGDDIEILGPAER